MSGEELYRMADIGQAELVRGELVRMSPTGHAHGFVAVNVALILRRAVGENKAGRVLAGEVGVYTGRNPDTVRGMDVAFISHQRLQRAQPDGFLDVTPELIVEVLSPGDRWGDVLEKVAEYFAADALMVWLVEPRTRQVYLYRSRTDVVILTGEDEIAGIEFLPELRVPVAELFAD